jgi:hypothetical protein
LTGNQATEKYYNVLITVAERERERGGGAENQFYNQIMNFTAKIMDFNI